MDRARVLRRADRFALKGANGFGYDPLFFYPPFGKTFGEIELRNQSHGQSSRQGASELGRGTAVVD